MAKINDNQVYDRRIVLSDTHGKFVDRAALNCVLRAIEIIKPTGVIHLGDIGEWESVNHHRFKRTRLPDPHLIAKKIREDVADTERYVLDPLDEACDRAGVKVKDITTGNHDRWLDQFVDANPDYANTTLEVNGAKGYRFADILRFADRGWTVHPCGKLLKLGRLHFYHGHLYGGMHHALNHLRRMGVNIMYGHWHDYQAIHVTHADGPKGAYSLGCLKRFDVGANDWLEHRPTNWSHYFAVVDWYNRGHFSVHSVPIIFGKCTLLGTTEVIDGTRNWKAAGRSKRRTGK